MKTIAAAVIASLFAVAPATAAPKAAPTTEPSPTASATPIRNANTRYCYKTEITGSRLLTRVCKTRADWKSEGVIVPDGL